MDNSSSGNTQDFGVTAAVEGTEGVLGLSGYISTAAEESIMGAFDELEGRAVDLYRVRFHKGFIITSAGIALLIAITSRATIQKRPVFVEGLTPHYKKVFEMIGLSDYVRIQE